VYKSDEINGVLQGRSMILTIQWQGCRECTCRTS